MFQTAYMRGKRFLFTEDRIKNEDVPEGLFKYEIRHSDDDDTIPVEITDLVFVNFFGTLIGPEPIENWDEQTIMKRSVILEMDPIPEYYRDEEDDITEEEFDENGNKNTPVFYPMDGELDIDFDEEYDIPLEKVSKVLLCDIVGVEFPQKTKKRTYTAIVHYEGAYDFEVEATSEEEAREKAEKLFSEADPTNVWSNIDYEVSDCYEC